MEGSIAELITQIYIGIEIEYINKQIGLEWIKKLNEINPMLQSLKNRLKSE